MTRALLAAAAAALALSGCGSVSRRSAGPALPRPLARTWAAQADAAAGALRSGDACEAHRIAVNLQREVIAAVNAGKIPPRLQESLGGAVNELAARTGCP